MSGVSKIITLVLVVLAFAIVVFAIRLTVRAAVTKLVHMVTGRKG